MLAEKHRFRVIGSYSGAGAGIAFFALYGLLPSSFIGGIVALNMVGGGQGLVRMDGVIGRGIVGLFMILSVLLTGFISAFIGSICGRFIGTTLDRFRSATGSATMPSREIQSGINEKRQIPRALVSTVVRVEAEGQNCVADMNDLSEKGARLSFLNSPCAHIESGQRLVCTLPGNVVKESRVVWKEDSDTEVLVGIEFIDRNKDSIPAPTSP